MRKALIAVLVVAVVGVGGWFGDQAVRSRAEAEVAERIASELGTSTLPEVTLGGVPFSLALLTHQVPDAILTADAVPVDVQGHQVTLQDVHVTTGLIELQDSSSVVVHQVIGSASLSYADVGAIAGLPIAYEDPGRLQLTYSVTLLGQQFSFGVSALPELDTAGQQVTLTDPRLTVGAGEVPASLDLKALESFVKPIPIQLPHGLLLSGFTPTPDGVQLRFSADRVAP